DHRSDRDPAGGERGGPAPAGGPLPAGAPARPGRREAPGVALEGERVAGAYLLERRTQAAEQPAELALVVGAQRGPGQPPRPRPRGRGRGPPPPGRLAALVGEPDPPAAPVAAVGLTAGQAGAFELVEQHRHVGRAAPEAAAELPGLARVGLGGQEEREELIL